MSTALRSHTAWHLSHEDARLCLYSALLLPLARAECREAPNKSKTIALSRYSSSFNTQKENNRVIIIKVRGKAGGRDTYTEFTMCGYSSIRGCRHMFARMLKQKAKDAEKMGLLHEVVYGFCDYLGPQAQHLDQVEKRVGVG